MRLAGLQSKRCGVLRRAKPSYPRSKTKTRGFGSTRSSAPVGDQDPQRELWSSPAADGCIKGLFWQTTEFLYTEDNLDMISSSVKTYGKSLNVHVDPSTPTTAFRRAPTATKNIVRMCARCRGGRRGGRSATTGAFTGTSNGPRPPSWPYLQIVVGSAHDDSGVAAANLHGHERWRCLVRARRRRR